MPHPSSASRPPVAFERRPKPGGVRLLCHLDRRLTHDYTAAVARVAPRIEGTLAPEVLAHRVEVASRVPPSIVLRDWRDERRSFFLHGRRIVGEALVARADVAECYASISMPAVEDALGRCGAELDDALACTAVLERLWREGVPGLPVGPVASAVLANGVLARGDAALRGLGVAFVRWVDDWWIAVRSEREAGEVLDALRVALATAGLRLNERKTSVGRPSAVGGAPSGAEYHRAADAHAVPVLARANPLLSGDGGLAVGRRSARGARGKR